MPKAIAVIGPSGNEGSFFTILGFGVQWGYRGARMFVLRQPGHWSSVPSDGTSTALHSSLPDGAVNPQFRHLEVGSFVVIH